MDIRNPNAFILSAAVIKKVCKLFQDDMLLRAPALPRLRTCKALIFPCTNTQLSFVSGKNV